MASTRTTPSDPNVEPGTTEAEDQAAKDRKQQEAPLLDRQQLDQDTTTDAMIKNKI